MTDNWLIQAINAGLIEFARTGYGQYADLIRSTRSYGMPWYHWQEWGKLNRN